MNILDPRFKYTPSHETDIRKTFERVRQEMKQRQAAFGRPEHNPQPLANAEIVRLTKRK